jgi:hypothetical protein
MHVMHRGR